MKSFNFFIEEKFWIFNFNFKKFFIFTIHFLNMFNVAYLFCAALNLFNNYLFTIKFLSSQQHKLFRRDWDYSI